MSRDAVINASWKESVYLNYKISSNDDLDWEFFYKELAEVGEAENIDDPKLIRKHYYSQIRDVKMKFIPPPFVTAKEYYLKVAKILLEIDRPIDTLDEVILILVAKNYSLLKIYLKLFKLNSESFGFLNTANIEIDSNGLKIFLDGTNFMPSVDKYSGYINSVIKRDDIDTVKLVLKSFNMSDFNLLDMFKMSLENIERGKYDVVNHILDVILDRGLKIDTSIPYVLEDPRIGKPKRLKNAEDKWTILRLITLKNLSTSQKIRLSSQLKFFEADRKILRDQRFVDGYLNPKLALTLLNLFGSTAIDNMGSAAASLYRCIFEDVSNCDFHYHDRLHVLKTLVPHSAYADAEKQIRDFMIKIIVEDEAKGLDYPLYKDVVPTFQHAFNVLKDFDEDTVELFEFYQKKQEHEKLRYIVNDILYLSTNGTRDLGYNIIDGYMILLIIQLNDYDYLNLDNYLCFNEHLCRNSRYNLASPYKTHDSNVKIQLPAYYGLINTYVNMVNLASNFALNENFMDDLFDYFGQLNCDVLDMSTVHAELEKLFSAKIAF